LPPKGQILFASLLRGICEGGLIFHPSTPMTFLFLPDFGDLHQSLSTINTLSWKSRQGVAPIHAKMPEMLFEQNCQWWYSTLGFIKFLLPSFWKFAGGVHRYTPLSHHTLLQLCHAPTKLYPICTKPTLFFVRFKKKVFHIISMFLIQMNGAKKLF